MTSLNNNTNVFEIPGTSDQSVATAFPYLGRLLLSANCQKLLRMLIDGDFKPKQTEIRSFLNGINPDALAILRTELSISITKVFDDPNLRSPIPVSATWDIINDIIILAQMLITKTGSIGPLSRIHITSTYGDGRSRPIEANDVLSDQQSIVKYLENYTYKDGLAVMRTEMAFRISDTFDNPNVHSPVPVTEKTGIIEDIMILAQALSLKAHMVDLTQPTGDYGNDSEQPPASSHHVGVQFEL